MPRSIDTASETLIVLAFGFGFRHCNVRIRIYLCIVKRLATPPPTLWRVRE
jgi:hypothetical protein